MTNGSKSEAYTLAQQRLSEQVDALERLRKVCIVTAISDLPGAGGESQAHIINAVSIIVKAEQDALAALIEMSV